MSIADDDPPPRYRRFYEWPTHRAKRLAAQRSTPTEPVDPRPDWRDIAKELDRRRKS